MNQQHQSKSIANPLCIILVKNGSKGDRLLFRYPYKGPGKQVELDQDKSNSSMNIASTPIPSLASTPLTKKSVFLFPSHNQNSSVFQSSESSEYLAASGSAAKSRKTSRTSPPTGRRNPYSLSKNDDLFISGNNLKEKSKKFSPSGNEMLGELSDKDMSNLLAVSSELSERKFELKLNDVRFVGHPTLMHNPKDIRPCNALFQTSVKLFHIVFCLNAVASHSIVKCFYDLSKRLGIGLRHEEYRCGFLSAEMKTIISTHDEACTEQTEDKDEEDMLEKLYDEIMSKSKLAELMKKVYDDVCQTGYLFLKVNNWVQISFCLPQRIHILPFRTHAPLVEPESIHRCLEAIRPYHTILLLIETEDLISTLWVDASSTIPRLLHTYSPLKSLQTMAADADLTLSQVVEIASHLVYWAHATVIYPMCESNVYVIASDAPVTSATLTEAFSEAFPGVSLSQTMADFSLPMALGERINPVLGGTYVQTELVRLVTWLLKHRILIQLHTYIYLLTYLDGCGATTGLDMLTVNVDPDVSLNLSINVRSYEHDDEDDVTVSDSFSETTAEEVGVSPLRTYHESDINTDVERVMVDSESTRDSEDTVDGAAQKNNNNEESIEPLEKFKGTLNELNEAVKRAVALIKSPVSIQDINMFSKLSKYFTGEFHLEEIMYRENVRRSQLMLLLDKFRDVLITVEKEDSDINFFKMNCD